MPTGLEKVRQLKSEFYFFGGGNNIPIKQPNKSKLYFFKFTCQLALKLFLIMPVGTVLPGQPISLPARGPAPKLGTGVYERDGQIRASLLGSPHFDGSVRRLFRHYRRISWIISFAVYFHRL